VKILDTEQIAKIAHEVNRAFCIANDDKSQEPWEKAPQWQREHAIDGVMFVRENPDATAQDSHNNWLQVKRDDGWVYGPVKDVDKKEHPCMRNYYDLPNVQRTKDALFIATVKACL